MQKNVETNDRTLVATASNPSVEHQSRVNDNE